MRTHTFSEDLLRWAYGRISGHGCVLTPRELGLILRKEKGLGLKDVKSLIHALVSRGDCEYIDVYGRTCLAPSFSRPVRVSPQVVIKPPECRFETSPGDVVISLHKGIAFGRGTHATTKLCIRALNYLFEAFHPALDTALDIGTGNGVLAVVAAKFGVRQVCGCDIDRVAVHEARENSRINDLDSHVSIGAQCDFSIPYDLIMANLRYPTLISLHETICDALSSESYLLLSGIKNEEVNRIHSFYGKSLQTIWTDSEEGWSSLLYRS